MNDSRIRGIVDTDIFDYGPDRSRLLVRAWRKLALGTPIDRAWVGETVKDLGMQRSDAVDFLDSVCERDEQGRIVGILGLSLNSHPHRFLIDGRRFSTWCAIDTLFLPAMIGKSGVVESVSPESNEPIRLEVTPEGPRNVTPAGAVVSIPMMKADEVDTSSTEGIWSAFCHRIYFFATEEKAKEWIRGKGEMEIVTVQDAWNHAMDTWARVLPFAREAQAAA